MTSGRLFDQILRNYEGPAEYAEPSFRYLNRSARLDVERVREVLEDWFSRYPSKEKPDLRGRFRSTDNNNHLGAFFELFLHELLLRLGCQLCLHPDRTSTSGRRPDFLVTSIDGSRFYVEATLATDKSLKETAAQARMNVVYDALDKMDSPNFFVGMHLEGAPDTPPPAKKIRSFLEKRLASLDPDEIAQLIEASGQRAAPHWYWEHDGWEIVFFPIPKLPDVRNQPGIRPLGMRNSGFRELKSSEAIRNVLLSKAQPYGDLELPYVIAVNALGEFVKRIDIMEALFGTEQFVVKLAQTGPSSPEMTRKPDGLWTSDSGPRYTRVSAVLLGTRILPHRVSNAEICLYHNPWAERPYVSPLTILPQALPKGSKISWTEGQNLRTLFELPEGWPNE